MQAAASGAQHGFDRHHAQTVGGGDEMPRAYQPYHRSTLVLEALELVSPYLVIALTTALLSPYLTTRGNSPHSSFPLSLSHHTW